VEKIMALAFLVTTLLTVATVATSWARCPGDFNLDETTTVDEIVAAVNAALNGCPAPVGCPIGFDEPTEEDACFFVGRYHPLCGVSNLEATFLTDGEDVIVSFFDPDIDFFAEVIDEGIAEIYAWQDVADPPQEPVALEGEILLSDPPRDTLTVIPFDIPFAIDDCDFERYDGRFAEYVVFTAIANGGAAATARRSARGAVSRARLRGLPSDARLKALKELRDTTRKTARRVSPARAVERRGSRAFRPH
jgi:hypothetical protein